MRNLNITFNLGSPFNPYEQLLGVLPTLSKAHVPIAFQGLMSNENSEIIDFYPEKFPIDLNGKKYAWQGVALLPFIDETRLVAAMKPFYKDLTEAQLQECLVGNEYVFSGEDNEIYEPLCLIYGKNKGIELVDVDLFGSVSKDDNVCLPGSTLYNPFEEMKLDEIPNNASISAVYVMPSYHARFVFPARLLRGVRMPNKQLNAIDFDFVRSGGGSRGRGRGRGGYDSRYISI